MDVFEAASANKVVARKDRKILKATHSRLLRSSWKFLLPGLLCAAYAEIVSSILLAVGLFSRLNALILLFTMLIAVFFHLKKDGLHVPPLETASLYALWFSFFLPNGGGLFFLDTAIASWLGRSTSP